MQVFAVRLNQTSSRMAVACERGLIILRAGLYGNVVRTLVPLTITDRQLHDGLDRLDASIGACWS